MKRILVAALLGVCGTCFGSVIKGLGVESCAVMIAEGKGKEHVYVQWILGYLSAINVEVSKKDFLKGSDGMAILTALKLQCEKNPHYLVVDASDSVIIQLFDNTK